MKVDSLILQVQQIYMETSPFMVVVYKGGHGADLDGVRVIG